MARSPALTTPPAHPWVTLLLTASMVLVHAVSSRHELGTSMAGRLALLDVGAKSGALIADASEGWRIVSAHFVHTSWMHLAFNLAFFFPVSGALEAVLRRADFVLLLACIATTSGFFSLLWTPEISAGASGLVYGVLATAVLIGIRYAHRMSRPMRLYFGLWVLPFLMVILFLGANNPSLDHFSHLGGLVGGVLATPFLRLRGDPAAPQYQRIRIGLAIILLLAVSGISPAVARGFQHPWRVVTQGIEIEAPPGWRVSETAADATCDTVSSRLSGTSTLVHLEIRRILSPQTAGQYCVPREAASKSAYCEQSSSYLLDGVLTRQLSRTYRSGDNLTLVQFESPVAWWEKYDETRTRVFGSIRAAPQDRATLSAAHLAAAALP